MVSLFYGRDASGSRGAVYFFGGTCGGSDWREKFKRHLYRSLGHPTQPYVLPEVTFDPRAPHWTFGVVSCEKEAKRNATVKVFYLGNPNDSASRASMYSGGEAMLYAVKEPDDTAIIFEPQFGPRLNHDDKQRIYLADLISEESPDAHIYWNLPQAAHWAAGKLVAAFSQNQDATVESSRGLHRIGSGLHLRATMGNVD